MVVITCKECKESIYLTPHAFWNISDFGAKCPKCNAINTITLGSGGLTSIKNKVGQLLRNSYKKKVSQIIGEI
jgi:phage FluMu protein Com